HVVLGGALAIAGTLKSGTLGLAGRTVTVSRTDPTGTAALPSTTTDANGEFAVNDTAHAWGTADYTFAFAGDAGHPATSYDAHVDVTEKPVAANGQIAFSCLAYPTPGGSHGWFTADATGRNGAFHAWTWGPYAEMGPWSADGTEMTHIA